MDNINNNELEEMRAQMALLKTKLDREEIVNDRLMRETMKQKVNFVNHKAWTSVITSLVTIVLSVVIYPYYGFSWWLTGYTVAMMLVCILFTWLYHRNFTPDMMNGDLLTAVKQTRKLKKDYQTWSYIGYPMVGVWVVWFIYEVCTRFEDAVMARAMVTGLVVGLVIGGIIGLRLKRITVKHLDEIIESCES